MKTKRGKLVVFEGIDGTGKSTQIGLLGAYLDKCGIGYVTDYEPTRGEWGMKVRAAAAAQKRLPVEEEIECLLKDRREHVEKLIEPALEGGKWVLLDRYYPSMLAYQGASGADVAELQRRNEEFAPIPDLTLWLDIPIEEAIARIDRRGEKKDAYEKRDFLERCMRLYAGIKLPNWVRIDASGSPQATHTAVRRAVENMLG